VVEADPSQTEGETFLGGRLSRESWTGDLDGMIERRFIRALVVQSRTLYFYDQGQARGIAYEALSEFERTLNKSYGFGPAEYVHVVFVPVSRDRLLPDLVEGLGDIAVANLTITPERRQLVDFSIPTGEGVKEIVVSGPSSPVIETVSDLAGKEIHVRRSSSYYGSLQRLNLELRREGLPAITIREADENLEDEDILEMVNAGIIPLTIIDSHKATLWSEVFDDITVLPEVAISADNAIGWAFRKNSPKFAEAINAFIKPNRQGTLFGNTLLRRYYQNSAWIHDVTSDQEMEKYRSVVGLFQKYAEEYDFDWLMITAQAYQESRLDPGARSAVGAVGIMQVMPSTAEADPISVKGVEGLEANIHAGVKILRYYSDQYFDEPELDDLNRMLFSFAAYNAGPNRINRLRRRAAEQGLDPNVWFRNVELLVAKSVGREPVTYVSNVFKYYLAYKLAAEASNSQGVSN
jgi:membrane-bound lytic murein transglycosylase MltF